ncbi:hypothetical protein FR483_n386R [Paramecium bursaria Chlorella virus FR483]|uniref:Uncharacterized protein n386R n=1 Tax=Paramecium bursaria Chlorella virus FR483 TaxID=399781 RepID=A7J790_PBCVF|nr:hypothetical protein FR483_n386R [Paramecium bursaria Chlorella virus FR483]ABT15671.1 hypothetical protein FR483_n386R [Paramecium bursaria Chlorella virus FR483]
MVSRVCTFWILSMMLPRTSRHSEEHFDFAVTPNHHQRMSQFTDISPQCHGLLLAMVSPRNNCPNLKR